MSESGPDTAVILTMLLTSAEIEALVEAVTFDTSTSPDHGGHPASQTLLIQIHQALKEARYRL